MRSVLTGCTVQMLEVLWCWPLYTVWQSFQWYDLWCKLYICLSKCENLSKTEVVFIKHVKVVSEICHATTFIDITTVIHGKCLHLLEIYMWDSYGTCFYSRYVFLNLWKMYWYIFCMNYHHAFVFFFYQSSSLSLAYNVCRPTGQCLSSAIASLGWNIRQSQD